MNIQNLEDVWVVKYHPKTLEDVIINDDIRQDLEKWTKIPQNLLFYGKSGIGKTTLVKMLVQKFVPNSYLYVDASVHGTIDTLRERINKFVATASIDGADKVVILDECDGASPALQNGLRIPMEEYLNTVKFIIIVNNRSKLIPAIKSRCEPINLSASIKDVTKRVIQILGQEKIKIDKEQVPILRNFIAEKFPDIRSIIVNLQKYCRGGVLRIPTNASGNIAVSIKEKLTAKKNVFTIRQDVVDRAEEFLGDYHSLMSELFDLYVKECNLVATLLISEHMYRDAFVLDHEINFSALLFNLSQKL